MTVDSSRPSLAVTCVTYCARRLSDSSTVFDRAALPVHSQSEPGRWQHSPVVMSGLSRGSGARGAMGKEGSQMLPQLRSVRPYCCKEGKPKRSSVKNINNSLMMY